MKRSYEGILLCAALLQLTGCSVNPDYIIEDVSDLDDLSVTLFEDGLEIPVGQTEKIVIKDLIPDSEENSGLMDMLKVDERGNYSISLEGEYSLDEQLSAIDLKSLASIEGFTYSQPIEYSIADFDPSDFKIEGQSFEYGYQIDQFDLSSITITGLSAGPVTVDAEFRDYRLTAEEHSFEAQFPTIDNTNDIISLSTLASFAGLISEPDAEYSVPGLGNIELTQFKGASLTKTIELEHASAIGSVTNIKLDPSASVRVELELTNCFLTSGSLVPDIEVDLGSIFKIEGSSDGKINLSDLALTGENSWKSSAEYKIVGVADDVARFSEGELTIGGDVLVGGRVNISDPKFTKAKFMSLDPASRMQIKGKVIFQNLRLEDMDINLGENASVDMSEGLTMPVNFSTDLPEMLSSIEKVVFDETKPITLSFEAANLDKLKTMSGGKVNVSQVITVSFPEGLTVEGAVDNTLTLESDFSTGKVEKNIYLKELVPVCSNGKIGFSGEVKVAVSAKASGSFSISSLPSSAAEDVIITATLGGSPAVKDVEFSVAEGGVSQVIDISKDLEFNLEGISDFGPFTVVLAGSPAVNVQTSFPTGNNAVAVVAEDLVISFPSFFNVDKDAISGIDPSCFDPATNSLTINGAIPEAFSIPVKSIRIETVEGENILKASASAHGTVKAVTKSEVIKLSDLQEFSGENISFSISIPDLSAESVALDGDISLTLDESYDFTVLKAGSFPEQLAYIEKVELDNVVLRVLLDVEQMPDLGTDLVIDADIELPEFFDVKTIKVNGVIGKGKPLSINQPIKSIGEIDLTSGKDITGHIAFSGSISAANPKIDLTQGGFDIKADFKASVGNGKDIDDPGTIAISRALAKVDYSIEQDASIDISGLEMFMNEDNCFAVNPELELTIETNLGIPIKGSVILTPSAKGTVIDGGIVELKDIELPYSQTASSTAKTVIKVDKGLSRLFATIPDKIEISIKAGVDSEASCVVEPSADYTCKLDYRIYIPFSFGEGFHLGISRDIDLEDPVDLSLVDAVGLRATVENTLPIGLELVANLYDENGEKILLEDQVVLEIKPATQAGVAAISEFAPVLTINKEGSSAKLSKIKFDISVSATADIQINESDYIRIKDIVIALPKGITIDPEMFK